MCTAEVTIFQIFFLFSQLPDPIPDCSWLKSYLVPDTAVYQGQNQDPLRGNCSNEKDIKFRTILREKLNQIHLKQKKPCPNLLLHFVLQMDRSKLLKVVPHGDFRRQSVTGHAKRRTTLFQLDPRRGSILHRDSRHHHPGFGDKKHADIAEHNEPHSEAVKETGEESGGAGATSGAETREHGHQGETLSMEMRPKDGVNHTGQQDATKDAHPEGTSTLAEGETEKSGIPEVRRNTLFLENQEQKTIEIERSGEEDQRSETKTEISAMFDEEFITKSKWSTLPHILSALRAMKGGGCSHLLNEVKSISEPGDPTPVDEQARDQITVMAQHAIDSK